MIIFFHSEPANETPKILNMHLKSLRRSRAAFEGADENDAAIHQSRWTLVHARPPTKERERKRQRNGRGSIKLKHTLNERITNERGIEQSYWSVRPIDQLNISLFASLLVRSVCSRLYTHGTIARDGPRYFRLSDRVRWVEAPGAPLITLTYDPINHRQIIHYLSRRGTKAGARSLSRRARARILASPPPPAHFFRTPTISLDRGNERTTTFSNAGLTVFSS